MTVDPQNLLSAPHWHQQTMAATPQDRNFLIFSFFLANHSSFLPSLAFLTIFPLLSNLLDFNPQVTRGY